MSALHDETTLRDISRLIAGRTGLHFPPERWCDLARNLAAAGRELGFDDDETYVQWLQAEEPTFEQLEALIRHLTVGETYFFREPESFRVLEEEILPSIIEQRAGSSRTLRLWSAGCCTGEEAYSLAITCLRSVPSIKNWHVFVLATDINGAFLRKAEAGIYTSWSFRGVSEHLRERYFSITPEGSFSIDASIRKLVHFSRHNLVADPYPSLSNSTNAMDIILCRNVLMYLTPEHQRAVAAAFHRSLAVGGRLMVSPAEASSELFPMFTFEKRGNVLFFRKTQPLPTPREAHFEEKAETVVFETRRNAQSAEHFREEASIAEHEVRRDSYETACRFLEEGNGEAGATLLEKIAREEPDRARAPLLLARFFADRGALEKALAWGESAIIAERTNTSTYFLVGVIRYELDRTEEAIDAFRKVLFLDRDHILSHYELGALFRRIGKEIDSKKHFRIALELLSARKSGEILPDSDGMTCEHLAETLRTDMGG